MSWLITHAREALNLEHVVRLYADKTKVKALVGAIPVTVAVDLGPDVGPRLVREIIDEVAQGHSVEIVGNEVRRITTLR